MSDDKELLEIVAELEKEGIVQPSRRLDAAKKHSKKRKAQRDIAEKSAPLVKALHDAGIDVDSVWDLIGREYDYESIVPLLLAHLEKPYPTNTRDGILKTSKRLRSRSVRPENSRNLRPQCQSSCRACCMQHWNGNMMLHVTQTGN
jgi:hypothetical protein